MAPLVVLLATRALARLLVRGALRFPLPGRERGIPRARS